ncbi:UDP-N-acetylmuramoyl-tripeptide--D-alanyl-D-alanine ligase [Melghirimyces thermohalophilus]|uniref:UDP-N-acetylmuramoyl-tripeptide--D-alanyl-D-alanine ligase n=1 Tax=Melghirimyces thermohalophilus TaxID=1236220 RepID=A0A1G6J745_9BACL|nr:UDP-N-acetylmuramoyl-tripeptide--D-alanyl-D-alanine ligase [Melghirimyces thermohalophilus]
MGSTSISVYRLKEAVPTKPIALNHCVRILKGSLIRGNGHTVLHAANQGKYKYLRKKQIYFYSTSRSHEKQIAALRRCPPAAVVIPRGVSPAAIPKATAVIQVSDMDKARWRLALWNWRQHAPRVSAVTGSAGKSTTTAMIASILKQNRRVVHTTGNLNTFRYLPSYLLRLSPGDQVLSLEMGMKSLDNIASQCRIVRPEVGAVTNVGEAHAGSVGGLNRVVQAKQELIDGLRSGSTLYLNADCQRSRQLSTRRFQGKVYTFGIHQPADIQGGNLRYTTRGTIFDVKMDGKRGTFFIPTWGKHNIYNALAAIGIARSLGSSLRKIKSGLQRVELPKMRLQRLQGAARRVLINDAWNANPTAMKAGLTVLNSISGTRPAIAVLGNMMELGSYTRSAHREVGRFAAQLNLHQLITYGREAREIGKTAIAEKMNPQRVIHFHSRQSLLRHLRNTPPRSIIYFKASRKQKFERIVNALANRK